MNNNPNDNRPFASECLWGLKDVIKVLVFFFFMAYIGTPAVFRSINYVTGKSLTNVLGENLVIILFSIFINALSCFYIIYIVCIEHKLPLSSLGLSLTNWKQNVFEGIKKYLIAIPIFALVGLVADFIFKLTDSAPQQQDIAKRVLEENSNNVLILMVIFGTFAAPIVEELLFRGFLQTALHRRFGRWKAILLSSFFFRLCT